MSDVSFPARISVKSETDLDGLPILSATVTPAPEAATFDLPAGPPGPAGVQGEPRTTFQKMGSLATAGARPTALGVGDRGKWWHRLDTNGMDFWTGTGWIHSPNTVGIKGPTAPETTITASTFHAETLTTPAVKVTANGAALTIQATTPAGLQGPAGPTGTSGNISAATDFDNTLGPTHRSMFAYSPASRKFKVTPPPNGFSPWSWYQEDFVANTSTSNSALVVGTFALPSLPFTWRPMVWISGYIQASVVSATYPVLVARLNSANGVQLALGAGIRASEQWYHVTGAPTFGDDGPKPLSPSSTYATVPAGEQSSLVVLVEKVGTTATTLAWDRANASAVVWAQPVQGA